jgi:hypothetical protein
MSLENALKLDDVHEALRNNDLKLAGRYARIYILKSIAV